MKFLTPIIMLLSSLLLSGNALSQEPATAGKSVSNVNTFNRLMKPKMKVNPSPMEDGIHDPENPGTALLQPPKAAFDSLDKSKHGNNVNWVSSLENSKISPRWDRLDETMQPIVFDLNIVREVKGSMPNVVYPHKQHTEWLDCSNCHRIYLSRKRVPIRSIWPLFCLVRNVVFVTARSPSRSPPLPAVSAILKRRRIPTLNVVLRALSHENRHTATFAGMLWHRAECSAVATVADET